ncbi:MAG TPA: hypothetical protein VEQ60_19685 [Longimicrobium sp.]|nr:hypothetical protein [Longimicrobium sp.]
MIDTVRAHQHLAFIRSIFILFLCIVMEPVTLLVAAVAAGAAAALKDTASQAVRDAYAALKTVLQKRYAGVDLHPVEQKPASLPKRESLAEDLTAAGAATDAELASLARQLLDVIDRHDPGAGREIGVDISGLRAAALRIHDVRGGDAGVVLRTTEIQGAVDISGIVGGREPRPQNP